MGLSTAAATLVSSTNRLREQVPMC